MPVLTFPAMASVLLGSGAGLVALELDTHSIGADCTFCLRLQNPPRHEVFG